MGPEFLTKTLEACISGDGYKIQEVLEIIQKTGVNVRTFAGQMTEWVVSNIEDALSKKQFPLYKSVFDRFTRIYVESKQVSVPMDVLMMSLCECITKNSEAIKYKAQDDIQTSPIDTTQSLKEEIPSDDVPVDEQLLHSESDE